MGINYTLVVQEDIPTKKAPGTLWLKASSGLLMVALEADKYHHVAAGKGNLSITPKTYYLQVSEGSSRPGSPQNGQIWLQDSRSYWVYLGKWNPIGGN